MNTTTLTQCRKCRFLDDYPMHRAFHTKPEQWNTFACLVINSNMSIWYEQLHFMIICLYREKIWSYHRHQRTVCCENKEPPWCVTPPYTNSTFYICCVSQCLLGARNQIMMIIAQCSCANIALIVFAIQQAAGLWKTLGMMLFITISVRKVVTKYLVDL